MVMEGEYVVTVKLELDSFLLKVKLLNMADDV
jgi:hypothetical protein